LYRQKFQRFEMAVPDFQSLLLPVLRQSAQGEVKISDVVTQLSEELSLSDEDRAELLPSGKQTTFANRVHWARTYLKQAGLVEATRRSHFQITDRGRDVLQSGVQALNVRYLNQFPDFVAFHTSSKTDDEPQLPQSGTTGELASLSPEDQIRSANQIIHEALGREIIDRILLGSPSFFERGIVALLLAMGYGGSAREAGRAIGKAGDDGIDGVIDQDALGLDRVYIQAKRYQRDNAVGPAAIRDFFGSLDMHKAAKGIFVTTSYITKSAAETAERLGKRIVLIDGATLAGLMIRYNVGCRPEEIVEIKRIDEEFFE